MSFPDRSLCAACLALVLVLAGAAMAAPPRTGTFEGTTSQRARDGSPAKLRFSIVSQGEEVTKVVFPSLAKCGRDQALRLSTRTTEPAPLVEGRIKIGGKVRGPLERRLRFRGRFQMNGRFPTPGQARGTWRLRAAVLKRDGATVNRCRTGKVTWRAANRP